MYDDFFSKAHELKSAGIAFATATVIRAEKPTSGKTGDKAIITADGVLHGWIGGSCAQPTVINEALKSLSDGESRFIRLTPDPSAVTPREGLIDLPMTCFSGGTLEIYIEPQYPIPRLLIMGNMPVAQSLAQIGKVMNYEVIGVDMDGQEIQHADKNINDLNKAVELVRPDTHIVVATFGNFDELALDAIVKARPAYIGLVASRKRFQSVQEYLRGAGLTESEISTIKAPAGLDIQAKRHDEIALSIMAEIIQQRRNRAETFDLSAMLPGATTTHSEEHPASQHDHEYAGDPSVAIDPICGMEVEIATAKYTHDHEGQTYYFCCAGCQTKFAADPTSYIEQQAPSGQATDPICHMIVDIATAKFMSEYEGQLYYFCCAGCKTTFDKEPEKYHAPVEV